MKKEILSLSLMAVFGFYVLLVRSASFDAPSDALTDDQTKVQVPPPAPIPVATPGPVPIVEPPKMIRKYNDGQYTGIVADAYYGNIQVRVTIRSGKIIDVVFLQYPNDRRNSIEINSYAMPILRSEAIRAQSANVDIVSGATDSSSAFIESLGSALAKAKV